MKKILIVLFTTFILACTKDEPAPDLTTQFIGNWKSEVQESETQNYWSTYNIERIDNTMIRLKVGEHFEILNDEFDDNVDEYLFDSVKVGPDRILRIQDARMIASGQEIGYEGSGARAGDKLVLNMVLDYDKSGNEFPYVVNLSKLP